MHGLLHKIEDSQLIGNRRNAQHMFPTFPNPMIHFKTLLATCQANPIDFQIDGTINTINVYVTLTP